MNGTLVKRKKEIVKHLHELINSSHHFKKLYYNEYKKMYKYKAFTLETSNPYVN